MPTLKQAKQAVHSHGCTITKRDREYRVNFIHGLEPTAYYTSDIEDAIDTAQTMGAWKRNRESEQLDEFRNKLLVEISAIYTLPTSMSVYGLYREVKRVIKETKL